MRARDQSSIFSTGGKFHPDYWLLLELHTLTLVARSYVLSVVTYRSQQELMNRHGKKERLTSVLLATW